MKNENFIAIAKDISADLRDEYKIESGTGLKIDFNIYGGIKLIRGGITENIGVSANIGVGDDCIIHIDEIDTYHQEDPKKEGIEDISKFVTHLKSIGLIDAGLSIIPDFKVMESTLEELVCLKVMETVPFVKGYRIKDVVKLREDL